MNHYRRSATSLLIICILCVSTLTILSFSQNPASAQTGTEIAGILLSDTTWTKANSPYSLSGNVLLNENITLTIEPGAIVQFNGYFMNVGGTLIANGTDAEKITLIGSGNSYAGQWQGRIVFLDTSVDSLINNTIINSTPDLIIGIFSSPIISNSVINGTSGDAIHVFKGSPLIYRNVITNNSANGVTIDNDNSGNPNTIIVRENVISNNSGSGVAVLHGKALVDNNTIRGNGNGIYDEEWWGSDNANFTNNVICNNDVGVYFNFFAYGASYSVSNNAIFYNNVAVRIGTKFPDMGSAGYGVIYNNTITKNTNAIIIADDLTSSINFNNIFENTNYAVWQSTATSASNVNASYNWWGTTDTAIINQEIYDFNDDFNLGTVTYDPILPALNQNTPSIPTRTISGSTGIGGIINPSGDVVVNLGSNQTFTVTPNVGYQLASVLIDGVPALPPYTINNVVTNDRTIYATFTPVPGPTQLNGIITSNLTLTKISSPYNVIGNVLVNNGVTLRVEAGAIINLGSFYLQIDGTLTAIGSSVDPIFFNGSTTISPTLSNGRIIFSSQSTSWDELTGSGCIIENSVLNTTSVSIDSTSPKINLNNFTGTTFISAVTCSGGSAIISNNYILGAGAPYAYSGVTCSGNTNAQITGNVISGWWVSSIWAYSGSPIIENNVITNSGGTVTSANPGGGIRILSFASPIIRNNTITGNAAAGITITDAPSPSIAYNNIYGNPYNIYIYSAAPAVNISAANNWWGTTDQQAISQTIHDYQNDFNLGNVTFRPFLAAPNNKAPTFIVASASIGGLISDVGITKINYGDDHSFTITPDSGYQIVDVLVNGSSVGSVSTYTIQNIQGMTNIEAVFDLIPTPSPSPTAQPTQNPTTNPTAAPTHNPTASPSTSPTQNPTSEPTAQPSPTVPEFPTIVTILVVIIVVTTILAVIVRGSSKKKEA